MEVTVADTGQGITSEFLPHVFERFRQADGSSKREFGGLGLGLSIVRHLVEMHGGRVTAASEGVGKGALFTVRLPLAVAVRPVAEEVARLQEPEGRPSEGACPPELNGLTVLVVDDEADTREYVQTLLENCQMKVLTASSAAEALEQVRSGRPDLIVSDVGLPGEDGFTFIRRVLGLGKEQGGWTPAVALTAYARPEDRKRCLLAGFRAHVPKPIDAVELLAVLGSLAPRREG